MEIRILLDISEKFEKAIRRLAYSMLAGGAVSAKCETAQNQDVPAEEAPTDESAKTDGGKGGEAPKAEPKKRAKAKKAAAPSVEISTPAAMADGGKDGGGNAENVAEAETADAETAEAAPETAEAAPETAEAAPETAAKTLYGVYGVAAAVAEPENEDELGKGAVGEIISELTGRLINRMNEEARDKATINRNLRAKCEELQLKFPTVPALIQAIGYGNAYKACIGEG
jgi:hypothetical protein